MTTNHTSNAEERNHVKPEINILMKHHGTDAKDCGIRATADFGTMRLTLRVDFLSPWLLQSFLERLHNYDERFAKTEIIGAINITQRFDVRLELPSGTVFKLRAYAPFSTSHTQLQIALEFFELLKDAGKSLKDTTWSTPTNGAA